MIKQGFKPSKWKSVNAKETNEIEIEIAAFRYAKLYMQDICYPSFLSDLQEKTSCQKQHNLCPNSLNIKKHAMHNQKYLLLFS